MKYWSAVLRGKVARIKEMVVGATLVCLFGQSEMRRTLLSDLLISVSWQ